MSALLYRILRMRRMLYNEQIAGNRLEKHDIWCPLRNGVLTLCEQMKGHMKYGTENPNVGARKFVNVA